MSWLYSQALVEASSVDTSSDGAPSAPLNAICTPHQFSHRDKMTDILRLSRYGLTYAVLTADHGEGVLTSFLAGFPVRTSQPLGEERASQDPDQASGVRWSESFARWSPDSSSWKTRQCSLIEGLGLFSETWPRWGSMRSGVCWERTTSEHHTKEIGSGSWPTPTKEFWGRGEGSIKQMRTLVDNQVLTREEAEQMTGGSLTPHRMQAWPTPTKHNAKECASPSEYKRNTPTLADQVGGHLSPMWVEWLMGWPMGWTDLEPLEMDRFQEWRRLHLTSYTTD